MSTKIDKNGITCNKIVTDELQTSDGTKYFKETDLDSITINDAAIENATKIAVNAATSAENNATTANTAKLAAETAAENALASSTAAEQAKTDALAAQTKAEEEAVKAEQNATLLGDAALQGRDNTFTGTNVFAGVTNLLPADYWRYDCCTTGDEVRALAGENEDFTNWVYPLRNLSLWSEGGEYDNLFNFPSKKQGERIYLFSEWSNSHLNPVKLWGIFVQRWNGKTLTVYFPNVSGSAYHGFTDLNVENVTIIIPKITSLGQYFFNYNEIQNLCIISGATSLNPVTFWSYGRGENRVKTLNLPLNKIQNITWVNSAAMTQVLSGFPFATVINFQNAKLDKSSVLRIINSIQAYDAQTMETVPELTLGIDPTLDGDEEINTALLNAQTAVEDGGKGWNVAVNGFTITPGEATTEGLTPHIYANRNQNEEGVWVDADGTRWSVRYGNTVLENWVANEQLGYEEFATLDDALALWDLTEYVPPIEEIQENI